MTSTQTLGDYPGTYDLRVRLADDDHYGHVNNAVYYEYFDTAVNGWLIDATGDHVREMPALGVVVSSSCTFLREIRFPDILRVGVRASRVGTSSVTYEPAIFRLDADGQFELCATGEFVHVYVDPVTRRPVEIPAKVKAALSEIQ